MREPPYPFVKWCGGKSRMMGHIMARVPEKVGRFYEPFLGGGSVFLELVRQKRFARAVLGDANPDLMNAYEVIRDDVEGLISELQSGVYRYDKNCYLDVRASDPLSMPPIQRAARFIYLNRTCFNGLYRVNGQGHFNVPFGKYKDPVICDAANLRAVRTALRRARLAPGDFAQCVKGARKGDFVYFDPPYLPISDTSKFTSYTEGGFGLEQHIRLSMLFRELADRGVCVILSNSSSPQVRRLYEGLEVVDLRGARNVGGPADYRKPVTEIMVVANGRPAQTDEDAGVALVD